jgi:small conductance mechanosensitive channel
MKNQLLAVIFLLLTIPVAGTAQAADELRPGDDSAETAQSGQEITLADEALGLLESIDEHLAQAKQLRSKQQAATGEEQALAIVEIMGIEDELRDAMDKLLATLKKQEADGGDVSETRMQLARGVTAHGEALRKEITAIYRWLEESIKQRDGAEPEKLLALDQQIGKYNALIDTLIGHFLDNVTRAESVGSDTGDDLAYIDDLLQERAGWLKGQILLTQQQLEDSNQQLKNALEDQKPPIQARINIYNERVKGLSGSLSAIIKAMDSREMDTSEYSQLLIQTTGEITAKVLDRKVLAGMLQQWLKQIKQWLIDNGPGIFVKIIVVLLILFVFRMLGNFTGRVVARGIASSKLSFSKLLEDFFVTVASKAVLFLGILIALSQLGIQLGPLLAGLGVAGFIIGFALQDTLSNFASGMMILIYRPFDVGDLIEAGGVMGKVSEMSLVSTSVLTVDNQKLVVPNNKIWGDVIRNVTAQNSRRIDMTFGIGYSDDIAHAERVLNEIVQSEERVLDDPEPVIRLHNLGESSVDFIVRPWVRTTDYWEVYWDITRKVKERFDAEGISIPFPQRDVHIFQQAPQA